jgi:hypothetical protein
MAGMITLAAIDDDRMLLSGLRSWLGPVDGIELTVTATQPRRTSCCWT